MADQSDRPEPDHSEDPRRQETGEGYPETSPEGAQPDGSPGGEEQGPEADAHADRAGAGRAPGTSAPEEGDPQQATGNPDAAGG
jgi:hypothetical protein